MDLVQLRQMGLVSSNPLVKRDITIKFYPLKPEDTWASPTVPERETELSEGTLSFWLRKFTAADSIAIASVKSFEERAFEAIHRSVFTEDGKHVFPTVEDAYELNLEMFAPLLTAINEINETAQKKSQPRTNGGMALPSPSAGGRSRSGKTSSVPKKPTTGSSTKRNTVQ